MKFKKIFVCVFTLWQVHALGMGAAKRAVDQAARIGVQNVKPSTVPRPAMQPSAVSRTEATKLGEVSRAPQRVYQSGAPARAAAEEGMFAGRRPQLGKPEKEAITKSLEQPGAPRRGTIAETVAQGAPKEVPKGRLSGLGKAVKSATAAGIGLGLLTKDVSAEALSEHENNDTNKTNSSMQIDITKDLTESEIAAIVEKMMYVDAEQYNMIFEGNGSTEQIHEYLSNQLVKNKIYIKEILKTTVDRSKKYKFLYNCLKFCGAGNHKQSANLICEWYFTSVDYFNEQEFLKFIENIQLPLLEADYVDDFRWRLMERSINLVDVLKKLNNNGRNTLVDKRVMNYVLHHYIGNDKTPNNDKEYILQMAIDMFIKNGEKKSDERIEILRNVLNMLTSNQLRSLYSNQLVHEISGCFNSILDNNEEEYQGRSRIEDKIDDLNDIKSLLETANSWSSENTSLSDNIGLDKTIDDVIKKWNKMIEDIPKAIDPIVQLAASGGTISAKLYHKNKEALKDRLKVYPSLIPIVAESLSLEKKHPGHRFLYHAQSSIFFPVQSFYTFARKKLTENEKIPFQIMPELETSISASNQEHKDTNYYDKYLENQLYMQTLMENPENIHDTKYGDKSMDSRLLFTTPDILLGGELESPWQFYERDENINQHSQSSQDYWIASFQQLGLNKQNAEKIYKKHESDLSKLSQDYKRVTYKGTIYAIGVPKQKINQYIVPIGPFAREPNYTVDGKTVTDAKQVFDALAEDPSRVSNDGQKVMMGVVMVSGAGAQRQEDMIVKPLRNIKDQEALDRWNKECSTIFPNVMADIQKELADQNIQD